MKEEKRCLECNEVMHGRSDKKFCDDQCRNNFNNRQNSDSVAQVRNINNALRKNRRILEALLPPEGRGNVSKTKMLNQGFNFTYHTHVYTSKKGLKYTLCYDYGYLPLDNDYFMIVKWGDERDVK
jgi:hypothetical protein